MDKKINPESLMMSYGYKPELSEGSIKPPIFMTSTFVFKTAEEGKAFFEIAYGLRSKDADEELGLIYSRINNPNLQILEERLSLWDGAEECAVFESGMSAISTVMLEFLKPGDLLLYSSPTYGGTDHFINHYLKSTGIESLAFHPDSTQDEITAMVSESGLADRLALVYIETPANPTNGLIDIEMGRRIADHFQKERDIFLAVDNTYMGPVFSQPLKHGADIVIYSATKYIAGHSDLLAGAVLGNKEVMARVKGLRTFLGNMAGPYTGWLLMRSLETLQIRMEKQADNAAKVADYLITHPAVESVKYLGHLTEESPDYEIYRKQYTSGGGMISFYVKEGEKEAFAFLNKLKLIKLAVSLGSTESLAEHPMTMTHADVSKETKERIGITPNLVRLSVGIENADDLINDIMQSLDMLL